MNAAVQHHIYAHLFSFLLPSGPAWEYISFPKMKACLLICALALCGLLSVRAQNCGQDSEFYLDGWLAKHQIADIFDDPDKDGIPNFVEFGFGTDPFDGGGKNGAAAVGPQIRLSKDGHIELVIQQPEMNCPEYPSYGRHWFWISVFRSNDLENWEEIAQKPGLNGPFHPAAGFTISENHMDDGTYEIVIREEAAAASALGGGWFRLSFYIVS